MSSTTETDPEAMLAEAIADYEAATDAVERIGEDAIEEANEAVSDATVLLDRYEDDATGTGNYRAYATFRSTFTSFVDELDDELPRRDAFEEAKEAIDKRRLHDEDFERAREALDPVRSLGDRLTEREKARRRYVDARRAVRRRIDGIDDRIDELAYVRSLGNADLDAPVERLRDPIERYDDAVRDAFDEFRREESAREVFAVLDRAAWHPLVPLASPPDHLREYVETNDVGTEPIPTLLSYADYSTSKLDHYVDDPTALRRNVATERTFLEGLDAEALTIGWPPPPAEQLRWRCEELVPVVARLAPEEVVARLRDVRNLAFREDYDRLRQSAAARTELSTEQRERLTSGAIERELAELREQRERLEKALEDGPEP